MVTRWRLEGTRRRWVRGRRRRRRRRGAGGGAGGAPEGGRQVRRHERVVASRRVAARPAVDRPAALRRQPAVHQHGLPSRGRDRRSGATIRPRRPSQHARAEVPSAIGAPQLAASGLRSSPPSICAAAVERLRRPATRAGIERALHPRRPRRVHRARRRRASARAARSSRARARARGRRARRGSRSRVGASCAAQLPEAAMRARRGLVG